MSYLTNAEISKWHFRPLLFLTLLLIVVASICSIPGVIDHPQFATNLSAEWVEKILKENALVHWAYVAFFIIDFFWSFLLLWAIWKLVKDFLENSDATRFGELCFIAFTAIVIGAWIFDCIENYFYLCQYQYIPFVVNTKIALYSISFLVTLILLLFQYFDAFWPTFVGFLKSSIYSLIILAVLGVFLPEAPQVNSIVVNLYESWVNFLILLVVAPTYAVVLAHYPSYFNITKSKRDWYSAKIKLGLFGTIFYKNKKKKPKTPIVPPDAAYYRKPKERINNKAQKSKVKIVIVGYLNFLFRVLGILFYCALLYVIGYTSEINFNWSVSISKIVITLLGIGVVLLYYLRRKKNEWLDYNFKYLENNLPDFYDGDYTPKDEVIIEAEKKNLVVKASPKSGKKILTDKEQLLKIKIWINWYLFVFILTLACHIYFFILLAWYEPYTYLTAIISLVCIGLQMITYIFYRTFRSVFRFTFFDEKNKAVLNAFYILRVIEVEPLSKRVTQTQIDKNEIKIKDFFEKAKKGNDFIGDNKVYKAFRGLSFGALSNNIVYLQVTIFIGFINAVFLLVINVSDAAALMFNPILIILSYLFFFYGIIVVITKNFIYYKYSPESFAIRNRVRYNFLLVMAILALIIVNRLGREYKNNLFDLKLVERQTSEEVPLEEYVVNLPKDGTVRYYIGAYGGGMKANAWTLTVLNELYKRDDSNSFFKNTVGISGASGGTMGLINMAAIVNGVENSDTWLSNIHDISTSNILALDLTHILGRDTFNHLLVPLLDLKGYDRSSKAMNHYAKLSNNVDQVCQPIAYRKFWKKLYEKQGKRFPILIANSTNVLGNQGMAVSVSTIIPSEEHSYLYQGANNILDINESFYLEDSKFKNNSLTLTYYDAASTSNRFPVISPAAKIETMGHFNDGGIYENSGLLSAYKLYRAVDYLEKSDTIANIVSGRNVFINIVNDKVQYIRQTFEKYVKDSVRNSQGILINKVNENTEINAILGSIASTEMMPIYIKTELKRLSDRGDIDFETIYLPHRFTVSDIKAIYGEEFNFGNTIDESNDTDDISDTNETMYNCVKSNNKIIESLIINSKQKEPKTQARRTSSRIPIIEPPMSRVIAEEAYEFMQTMLEHPTTRGAIDSILEKQKSRPNN